MNDAATTKDWLGRTHRDEDEITLGAVQRLAATLDQDPERLPARQRSAGKLVRDPVRADRAAERDRARRPSQDRGFPAAAARHAADVRGTPHQLLQAAAGRRHGVARLHGDARGAEDRAHRIVHARHRHARDERAIRPCPHGGTGPGLSRRRRGRHRRPAEGSSAGGRQARMVEDDRARSGAGIPLFARSPSTPIASITTCLIRATPKAIRRW